MVTMGRTMRLNEVINAAKEQLHSILALDVANVIAASKTNDGWNVKIDLIERKLSRIHRTFLVLMILFLTRKVILKATSEKGYADGWT